jgi:hypothetical protein
VYKKKKERGQRRDDERVRKVGCETKRERSVLRIKRKTKKDKKENLSFGMDQRSLPKKKTVRETSDVNQE